MIEDRILPIIAFLLLLVGGLAFRWIPMWPRWLMDYQIEGENFRFIILKKYTLLNVPVHTIGNVEDARGRGFRQRVRLACSWPLENRLISRHIIMYTDGHGRLSLTPSKAQFLQLQQLISNERGLPGDKIDEA